MYYYKVMLGRGSQFAAQAIQGSFIGVDDTTGLNLTTFLALPEAEFRTSVRSQLEKDHPAASRGTISQYVTTLWRIAQGIEVGDIILSPTGTPGHLKVGTVTGSYLYLDGGPLPHRRAVEWRTGTVQRSDMSLALQNSSGGITAIIDLTAYAQEIAGLISSGTTGPSLVPVAPVDPGFPLEKELENFLVTNWSHTELGAQYDLYPDEDGNPAGQQYQTTTGPIDILARKKDGSELLVIELKRGRATDQVVGQIQRYMGFVKQDVAEPGQAVRGLIIELEDDLRLQYALEVAPNISFYRYKLTFQLSHTGGTLL